MAVSYNREFAADQAWGAAAQYIEAGVIDQTDLGAWSVLAGRKTVEIAARVACRLFGDCGNGLVQRAGGDGSTRSDG